MFDLTQQDFENGTDYGETKKVEITLEPNMSYTLSSNEPTGTESVANIYFNGGSSSVNGVFLNHARIAQTDENGKLFIAIRTSKISDIFNNYWLQLEQGTTATPYVPHAEQNLPFTLEEGEKLFLGDTLEDDGKHHRSVEVVLDGTEIWGHYVSYHNGGGEGYCYFITSINDCKPSQLTSKCSHFTNKNYVWESSVGHIGEFSDHSKTQYKYFITDKATLEEWKQYLAEQYANNTPVILKYNLAEEEEEIVPYNSTQQTQYNAIKKAKSENGITYIESKSDELGAILDVKAVQDMDIKISNIESRLALLE